MEIDNGDPGGAWAPTPIAQQPQQPLFGLIVPGTPVITQFSQVDATKFSLTLPCDGTRIPIPSMIREIVFFLTDPSLIPANHGIMIYWQITANSVAPTATGFALLGAVSMDRPSAVFQTGWSENSQVADLLSTGAPTTITFGVSLEPLGNMQNVGALQTKVEQSKLHVARQIAGDLFRFMQSFDTGGAAASGSMVVPNNIFDRWFRRFENRFQRDPNFFLKQSDEE